MYRFFDTAYGTHFFTASAAEKDQITATRPDLVLEGAEFLEHTAQPVPFTDLTVHDVNVRLLGDVAIIHARTTFTLRDGRAGASRYTDVWARRAGRWLAVSAQITRY